MIVKVLNYVVCCALVCCALEFCGCHFNDIINAMVLVWPLLPVTTAVSHGLKLKRSNLSLPICLIK